MGIKLITAPVSLAISLEDTKKNLRVVDSDDDDLITAIIMSATAHVETWLGRSLVEQTWELALDGFPGSSVSQLSISTPSTSSAIMIPKPPLIAIVQVAYDDSDGVEQIMDPTDYYVDTYSMMGWIVPTGTLTWPSTVDAINSVRVRFRAGYQDLNSPTQSLIPFDIRAGLLLTIGSLYEHRELQVVGSIAAKLPWGAEQLLRPHRVLLGMA